MTECTRVSFESVVRYEEKHYPDRAHVPVMREMLRYFDTLTAELAAARKAGREAYREGWKDGHNYTEAGRIDANIEMDWKISNARKELGDG